MTPEEKIVAAIEEQTAWLKVEEDDPLLPVLKEIRSLARGILVVIVIGLWALVLVITAEATPLLPPLGYEIGEPPAPPPNPNVQYWYTMDVPGPQGVLPQEVFAPRLVAQVASDAAVLDVPEPGTLLAVPVVVIAILVLTAYVDRRKVRSLDTRLDALETTTMRYHDALEQILISSTDEYSSEVARKALEESK